MISFIIHTFGNSRLNNLELTLKYIDKYKHMNINRYIVVEMNGEYAKDIALENDFEYFSFQCSNNNRSSSRNLLLEIPNIRDNDYIILHDSDILITSTFFDNILTLISDGYEIIGNYTTVLNLTESYTNMLYNNIDYELLHTETTTTRWYKHGSCGGSNTISMNIFLDVNGYDTRFTGWGHEDVDFIKRCIIASGYNKYIVANNIVYHSYHTNDSKTNVQNINIKLQNITSNKFTRGIHYE